MNQKRKLKTSLFFGTIWLLALMSLAGCGKKGKLDEGDCKCTVIFADIPKEFSMLEENLRDNFTIQVVLCNIANEKKYEIALTKKNSYEQEIFLHPGTYRVVRVYAGQAGYTGISVAADTGSLELSKDRNATLVVRVENTDTFTEHWMAMQPMPEILLADKFSGVVQINRKVEKVENIASQLHLEYDGKIDAYKKLELTDAEMGVTVTLLNRTDAPAEWKDCEVIGLQVFKNNVVFPEGVTLGMAVDKVCHRKDGLYGEPDKFTGSILYGCDFEKTAAIYNDSVTGNRITLTFAPDGSAVNRITYELAQFD